LGSVEGSLQCLSTNRLTKFEFLMDVTGRDTFQRPAWVGMRTRTWKNWQSLDLARMHGVPETDYVPTLATAK